MLKRLKCAGLPDTCLMQEQTDIKAQIVIQPMNAKSFLSILVKIQIPTRKIAEAAAEQ